MVCNRPCGVQQDVKQVTKGAGRCVCPLPRLAGWVSCARPVTMCVLVDHSVEAWKHVIGWMPQVGDRTWSTALQRFVLCLEMGHVRPIRLLSSVLALWQCRCIGAMGPNDAHALILVMVLTRQGQGGRTLPLKHLRRNVAAVSMAGQRR